MESLNSHMERLQWRRGKVMELSSQGHSQPEISKILQVGIGTVNRDLSYLRQQSKVSIQQYNERLPHEYDKCMMALTEILKESFDISHEPEIERREKLQALSLIKEVISTKLELLTNVTVVDDVIKFIDNHKKNKLLLSSNSNSSSTNGTESETSQNIPETTKEEEAVKIITEPDDKEVF